MTSKPKAPDNTIDDPENPEWTPEMFARARPAREVLPEILAKSRRMRGPQKAPTKVSTTVRLDRDVLEHFKADGRGWQTRLNAALREAVMDDDDATRERD